jgi:DNA-binding GntR family transcriptional regulator
LNKQIKQSFRGISIVDESLAEKAASMVRKKIMQGILEPGERLTETELAQALDISRACVREALQTLEYEGLVIKKANKYTQVVRLTMQDIEEIYRLRAAVECCCAETAIIKRLLPLDQLEQKAIMINKQYQTMENNTRSSAWIDEDFAFHELIVISSQNTRAIQSWMRLKSQAVLILYNAAFHRWNPEMIGDHMDLVKVLKDEPIPAALAILKEHIINGYESLERVLMLNP